MPINNEVLGMNARNFLYIRKYNFPKAKRRADDKLATKRLLLKHGIPTPKLLQAFENRQQLKAFEWDLPEEGFVIKPSRGYGGEGILVFKHWDDVIGETESGHMYTSKQLESHILDIFDGGYSLQYLPDAAFVEEKITPHPFFRKLTPIGLADVRVIVFNMVPIMAMVRLPTEESKGKANFHLGAICLGIDLRTGITVNGIQRDKIVEFLPKTKIKTRGIKIPFWDDILNIAVQCQQASKLGYAGVDIVIDAKKGPQVLEINARPGLAIQNANLASLRPRLERIENVKISSIDRGIELAKSLFAQDFADKVKTSRDVLAVIEQVTFLSGKNKKMYEAKVDSGAYRTSIDKTLVKELFLEVLPEKIFISAASGQQVRPAVKIDFILAGKRISTVATVADRSHLRYPIIIGRRDLTGFLINPDGEAEKEDYVESSHE